MMAQTTNFLIKCACGCGNELLQYDSKGRPRRFINSHQWSKPGPLNPQWKGGRWIDGRGYMRVLRHGHPRANTYGIVFEHIVVYEEHYKCCIPRWGVIHHKDGNKSNNHWRNLELTSNGKHTTIHSRLDMSDRICSKCNLSDTGIETLKSGYRAAHWYRDDNGGFMCKKCYHKLHWQHRTMTS
jgi:hypothetical protein